MLVVGVIVVVVVGAVVGAVVVAFVVVGFRNLPLKSDQNWVGNSWYILVIVVVVCGSNGVVVVFTIGVDVIFVVVDDDPRPALTLFPRGCWFRPTPGNQGRSCFRTHVAIHNI